MFKKAPIYYTVPIALVFKKAPIYYTVPIALVFKKAIKLRDLSGYSVGELINICSNDGQRLYGMSRALFVLKPS